MIKPHHGPFLFRIFPTTGFLLFVLIDCSCQLGARSHTAQSSVTVTALDATHRWPHTCTRPPNTIPSLRLTSLPTYLPAYLRYLLYLSIHFFLLTRPQPHTCTKRGGQKSPTIKHSVTYFLDCLQHLWSSEFPAQSTLQGNCATTEMVRNIALCN